jgi:uncharacterized membrane protein
MTSVKERTQLEARIHRWVDAGLIDAQMGERIRAFEGGEERTATLRWPVFLAMAFGGILFAAGTTLFVAAHWAEMSPGLRFSVVLLMVAILHGGGASVSKRFPAFSTTLHALGTVSLGAAIFLTAQIFNLHENWATGILLWAIGAAAGVILLRDWVQTAFLALLIPAWLISQWGLSTDWNWDSRKPVAVGLVLAALTYVSARIGEQQNYARRTLVWLGGIALLPCAGVAIAMVADYYNYGAPLSTGMRVLGWFVAVGGPLLLALLLRGRAAWMNLVAAAWAYGLVVSAGWVLTIRRNVHGRDLEATLILYGLCALGAVGLVVWGVYEKRKERVNLGVAGFAIAVLFFYFDSFMGKLGRSVSLLLLGVLCLAGGYALEMTRRNLMARMEARA